MKKIANIFLILLVSISLLNCEDTLEPSALDYIAFGADTYSTGVDPGGSTTFDIPVYTAKVYSAATTFNVTVDGSNAAAGSYDVPASVSIAAGSNEGILTVSLSDVNLGIGVNKITINFEDVAGAYNGEPTTLEYVQNCNEVSGTLDIVFDGYGSETAWEIIDALGSVVASKDAGSYSDGQASVSETITLCAGRDYTFTITDAYGDGLSYPADGTYTLTIGGAVKASGGGNFGASESNSFDTN
tara:strand:+ start:14197 stop:14925 length:729 start_codon:yes stop_codon:yes gene_type:complete